MAKKIAADVSMTTEGNPLKGPRNKVEIHVQLSYCTPGQYLSRVVQRRSVLMSPLVSCGNSSALLWFSPHYIVEITLTPLIFVKTSFEVRFVRQLKATISCLGKSYPPVGWQDFNFHVEREL